MSPVDLQIVCKTCGDAFIWSVTEQRKYHAGQQLEPRWCPRCRSVSRARYQLMDGSADPGSTLVGSSQSPLASDHGLPIAMGDHDPLLARVQELLLYSASGYVPQTRTFLQWMFDEDPNLPQVQARQWAGQHAHHLMAARQELLRLVREQDDTARHRVEQHVAARLEVMRGHVEARRLQAEMEKIELDLHQARLQAALQQQRLLQAASQPEKPKLSPAERVADEHRRRLQFEADTKQNILEDFFGALRDATSGPVSLHKKALKVRAVMEAFEMDEDALPDDARRIIRASERLLDED